MAMICFTLKIENALYLEYVYNKTNWSQPIEFKWQKIKTNA